MMDRWGWNSGPGDGHWVAMVVLMLVFWAIVALVVLVIVHYMRSNRPAPGAPSADNAPAEVLKLRFAKGEIDESEFTSRLNALKSAT